MSQQKVDKYKEQKARRKELVEKERRQKMRMKIVTILIAVVVLAGIGTGIGLTIRNQYIKIQNSKPDYSSSSLVVQDMAGILETEAAETGAEETAESSEGNEAETKAEETAGGTN